jgi:hypothetical protein
MLAESTRNQLVTQYMSRARGELTTALAFGHIIDDLNRQAGGGEFVRLAQSARKDELRHAQICFDLAQGYSNTELLAPRPRGKLPFVFEGAREEDQRILRTVFGCCFGETIAVQWLSDARKLCTDVIARQEGHEHLADEVKHSRLGWRYLSSPCIDARGRGLIQSYAPLMLELSLKLWTEPEVNSPSGLATFGCPDDEATLVSTRKALEEIILPGLHLCGCGIESQKIASSGRRRRSGAANSSRQNPATHPGA